MEGDDIAASYISWNDAAKFCERLSQLEGRTYRLPTEAEWECACRAGSTTKYSFGKDASQLEQFAWYFDSEPTHPSQVKQKSPNGFGLYDMHGNVWELCQDWYGAYPQGNVSDPTGPSNGIERIIRGGGFAAKAPRVRSAMRLTVKDLALGENHLGLRVVMVPEADSGQAATDTKAAYGAKRLHTFGVGGKSTENHYLGERDNQVGIPNETNPSSGDIFVLNVEQTDNGAILTNKAGKYLTARGKDVVMSDARELGSYWVIRDPLNSDVRAVDGWFSLESASDPGRYLRHYQFKAFAHKEEELSQNEKNLFLPDATWRFVDASDSEPTNATNSIGM